MLFSIKRHDVRMIDIIVKFILDIHETVIELVEAVIALR